MRLSRRGFLSVGAGFLSAALAKPPWTLLPGWREPLVDSGPFRPPQSAGIDPVIHMLNRTSFGPRPGDYARVAALAPHPEDAAAHYLEEQLAPDAIDDAPVEGAVRRLEVLSVPAGEFYEYKEHLLLQAMIQASLLRAVYSRRQLYEVMVQFWTDHFNIDSSKGECKWLKAADDRDVIRRHALGSFPELLRASALSPAMLWYLDGRVNRKQNGDDKPNENYARELLELHTLGVHGGYSQADVMETARCLTGWTVRDREQFRKGRVEFIAGAHDDGPKTVLGQAIPGGLGEGDIDRVLAIVALHPATARHLAAKLCRRFIADDPPPAAQEAVAKAFLDSRGDIRATLRALFSRAEFRAAAGAKFRRPYEFIAAALRAANAETDAGPPVIDYLLRMGHAPFQYPTPDGYPARAAPWMGTLLWRWNFAVALAEGRIRSTAVDAPALLRACGGGEALMASVLGRRATAEEKSAYGQSGNGLALLLASPGFQYG